MVDPQEKTCEFRALFIVGEMEIKTTNGDLRKSQGLRCGSVSRMFA